MKGGLGKRGGSEPSEGLFTLFAAADAVDLLDRGYKHLPVADFPGSGGFDQSIDGFITNGVGRMISTFTLGSRSTVYSRPR